MLDKRFGELRYGGWAITSTPRSISDAGDGAKDRQREDSPFRPAFTWATPLWSPCAPICRSADDGGSADFYDETIDWQANGVAPMSARQHAQIAADADGP